jgi:hypothetical protein
MHLTGVHLAGVHLAGVHLTRVHFIRVHLTRAHLIDLHPLMGVIGVHLTYRRASHRYTPISGPEVVPRPNMLPNMRPCYFPVCAGSFRLMNRWRA